MHKLTCLGICGKFYGHVYSFWRDRCRTNVINRQSSNWSHIEAVVPQDSTPRPLWNKLFAVDTLIFFRCSWPQTTSVSLNEDLTKISQWAYQWKMLPDPVNSKETQEIVFSRKKSVTNHGTNYFNKIQKQSSGGVLWKGVAEACNFIKKDALAKAFSCEFWQISKNTFSYGTPPEAASKNANSQGKCSKTFGSISWREICQWKIYESK